MKNFVTYSDAEIRPGPQLNVVIGPNGTGKSTLVCAMVLGLGGKPAVLGRAKEPRDFIKHGETTAIVECELYGGKKGERNVVIRRKILSDNSSQWKINGQESGIKEVLARVHKMNVQVDNLCQFLPQDKVSSFAEMDPRELLRETELAIHEKLHEQHETLIALKKEENEARTSVESKKKTLTELELANAELRRDVVRFQERERLMVELELLESKRPWVAFEASRLHAVSLQALHKELMKQIEAAEAELAPLEAEAQARSDATKSGAQEEETAKNAVRQLVTKRAQILESLKNLSEKTTMLEGKFEQVEQAEERRQQERRRLTKAIEDFRKQLQQVEAVEEQRLADMEHWKNEIERLKVEEKDISKAGILAQSQLQQLEDKRNKAIQHSKEVGRMRHQMIARLQSADPNIVKCLNLLEQNRAKLRGPVFGPLILHIKCHDNQFALWLDKILTYQQVTGFVFEHDSDRDLFTQWCTEARLPVPTLYFSPNAYSNLHRPLKKAQLVQHGLDGYLDSTFDAPDLVRWTLCNVGRLHTIPYGVDKVKSESHIEALKEFARAEEPVRRFVTPFNQFLFKPSSYASTIVITVQPFKEGASKWVIAQPRIDEENLVREAEAIEAEYKQASDALAQIKQRMAKFKPALDEAKNGLSNAQRSDIKSLKQRLANAENELQGMQVDVQAQRDALQLQIVQSLHNRMDPIVQLSELTPRIVEAEFGSAELLLKRGFLKSLAEKAFQAFSDARQQFAGLEERTKNAAREFNEAKENTRALKADAQKRSTRTPELEAKWATLPESLEDLDSNIENNRIRISAISPNRDVMDKFEARAKKIEELQGELANFDERLKQQALKIHKIKEVWLPEIKGKVDEINKNFQQFFSEIGCVGEVRLDTSTDDNFEKFGIDIWVSYRQTEAPRKLDARVQSGGERSVATMLYLIAIQQLSDCPFRLVDEINQGMDPMNERMIFDQVTAQASKPNTPQYFLITPKLLPDLNFTPAITMLCVFNGPFVLDQKDWVVSTP